MTDKAITYCNDEIDFLYLLHPHGQSDLVLFIMEEEISIRISHLFANPLEELTRLALAILGGQSSCVMRLHDGTGSVVISVERPPKAKEIIKVSVDESGDDFISGSSLYTATRFLVNEYQFIKLIYFQLAKIRALCKNEDYQKTRAKFPHTLFDQLEERMKALKQL